MANENPFTFRVYDKTFKFKGFVNDPISLVATPRYNQTGTAVLVVDGDHRQLANLMADGARATIELNGQYLMGGKINMASAVGPAVSSEMTFYLKDDFRLLHQVLGWPVPGNPLTNQNVENYKATGNAESIVKAVTTANMVNRLGMPITVAPNLNRGDVISGGVSFRFQPLYDQLFPAVETAGLGISIKQTGAGFTLDVYQPGTFPHTLSEASGVIQSWAWSSADGSATRIVVGGQGEGTAREFLQVKDSALEAEQNDIMEAFRDARDVDAGNTTLLTQRAQESLDEGAPQSGFSVSLSETENFRYGNAGLVVGATVTVDLGFVTRTDILRSVTLSYTRQNGLQTTPVIGDIQDNPDRTIAKFLARLKKGVTDLRVSK